MSSTEPPAEAELIHRLRTAFRPSLSIRAAAKEAEISEGRWRQIEKGYQQVTKSVRAPVRAPAQTLARMAQAVSASPDQLRGANRPDAAVELERLLLAKSPVFGGESKDPRAGFTDEDWEEGKGDFGATVHAVAEVVNAILAPTPWMNADDIADLDRMRHENERLPEVLAPFVRTPAGARQYMHQLLNILQEARDLFNRVNAREQLPKGPPASPWEQEQLPRNMPTPPWEEPTSKGPNISTPRPSQRVGGYPLSNEPQSPARPGIAERLRGSTGHDAVQRRGD